MKKNLFLIIVITFWGIHSLWAIELARISGSTYFTDPNDYAILNLNCMASYQSQSGSTFSVVCGQYSIGIYVIGTLRSGCNFEAVISGLQGAPLIISTSSGAQLISDFITSSAQLAIDVRKKAGNSTIHSGLNLSISCDTIPPVISRLAAESDWRNQSGSLTYGITDGLTPQLSISFHEGSPSKLVSKNADLLKEGDAYIYSYADGYWDGGYDPTRNPPHIPYTLKSLGSGDYTANLSVSDNHGNKSNDSFPFRVDIDRPIVQIGPFVNYGFTSPIFTNSMPYALYVTMSDYHSGVNYSSPSVTRYKIGQSGSWKAISSSSLNISINSEGSHDVIVEVADKAGNSSTSTRTITIDRSPPIVSGVLSQTAYTNGTTTATLDVYDSLTGIQSAYYRVRPSSETYNATSPIDSSWTAVAKDAEGHCRKTIVFPLPIPGFEPDADQRLEIYAIDKVGNSARKPIQITNIDRTAPSISFSPAPTGAWSKGPIILTANTTDTKSGIARVNWSPAPIVSTPSSQTSSSPSALPTPTPKPIFTFFPSLSPFPTPRPTLTPQASPSPSATPAPVLSFSPTCSFSAEGSYDVTATATDVAGNTSSPGAKVRLNIDNTEPVLKELSVVWSTVSNTYAISARVDNNSKGISTGVAPLEKLDYKIGNANWTNGWSGSSADSGVFSSPIIFPVALADGEIDIDLRATDAAGNERIGSYKYNLDRTAPTFNLAILNNGIARRQDDGGHQLFYDLIDISETSLATQNPWTVTLLSGATPIASAWSGGQPIISQVTDPVTEKVTITYKGSITIPANSSLADGSYTLSIRCTDASGNISTARSLSFVLDKTPPSISLASGISADASMAAWKPAGACHLATSTSTDVQSSTLRIGTSPSFIISPENGEYRYNFTQSGTYALTLTATDTAGNPSSVTGYARIDGTAPTISLGGVMNAGFYRRSEDIVWSLGDGRGSGVNAASLHWRPDANASAAESDSGWRADPLTGLTDGNNQDLSFLVKDLVGNTGRQAFAVKIDSTAPHITSVSATSTVNASWVLGLTLVNPVEAVSGFDVLCYALDDSPDYSELIYDGATTFSIPLSPGLADGSHSLRVFVQDKAGNASGVQELNFLVDTLGPEATVLSMSSGGIPALAGGTIATTSLTLTMDQSAGAVEWSYRVNSGNWSGYGTAPSFIISNFSQGLVQIGLRARDAVGNQGLETVFEIFVDSGLPGTPSIRGLSHPRASRVEDARRQPDALFSILPMGTSKSGIAGYEWELFVIPSLTASLPAAALASGSIVYTADAQLGIPGLADNELGEYYFLRVRSRAGNGLLSSWASFIFRVDSRPPEGLRLEILPQVDADAWYSHTRALLSWNQPADMTGVQSYYYFLTADEAWELPGYALFEDASDILSQWTSSGASQALVELSPDLLGLTGAGLVTVGLCALDYAGNLEWSEASFKADIQKPDFPAYSTTESLGLELDSTKTQAVLRWAQASDSVSGMAIDSSLFIASYEVSVKARPAADPNAAETLVRSAYFDLQSAPAPEQRFLQAPVLELYGLKAGLVYRASVIARDRAGNERERSLVFRADGQEPPATLTVDFDQEIGGYRLSGTREEDSLAQTLGYSALSITLPESIELYRIDVNNGTETLVRLPGLSLLDTSIQTRVDEGGQSLSFASALCAAGPYELRLGGYRLRGAESAGLELGFSQALGLTAARANYLRLFDGTQERQIALDSLACGFPPLSSLSSDLALLNPELAFHSRSLDSSGTLLEGLGISGVGRLKLKDGREELSASLPEGSVLLDTSNLAPTGMSFRYPAQGTAPILRSLSLAAGNTDAKAELGGDGLILRMGGNDYRLVSARLRGNDISILEARLLRGADEAGLALYNFVIDGLQGQVRQAPDFRWQVSGIVGPGGQVLSDISCSLDGSGWVALSGSLVYGQFESQSFSGLGMSEGAPDWNGGARLLPLSFLLHGFRVTSRRTGLTALGLVVDEGSVLVSGRELELSGLTVNQSLQVIAGGLGKAQLFPSFYPSALDSGYGTDLFIDELRITSLGLFMDARLPVSAARFPGSGGSLSFTNVSVYSDARGFEGNYSGEIDAVVGGFSGSASLLSIVTREGALRLRVGGFQTTAPLGLDPSTLNFENLEFSYQGLNRAGELDIDAHYQRDLWSLSYESLTIDDAGIGGRGIFSLPEPAGGEGLVFPQSRISAAGALNSAVALEPSLISLHGWETALSNARLESGASGSLVLRATTASLSLAGLSGPRMVFSDFELGADGSLSPMIISGSLSFFDSANGYRVSPSACRIDRSGIFFSGSIACAAWSEGALAPQASYGDFSIRLYGDGDVESGPNPLSRSYSHAGYQIGGQGFSFGREYITVSANVFTYRGASIAIGPISYYPEGQLARSGTQTDAQLTRVSLDIFGGRFETVAAFYDESGLWTEAFVSLPEEVGGLALYLDRVSLEADGGFGYEGTIERFAYEYQSLSFEFEDIWLSDQGLRIGWALITLPPSCKSVSIELRDFSILASGDFSLGGARADPFDLWGMYFELSGLSIEYGELSLQGAVGLPENAPGQLSGRISRIKEFRIALSGELRAFDLEIEGEFLLSLKDEWMLRISGLGARYDSATGSPFLRVANASLLFPAGYGVKEAGVSGISLNLATCEFDFSSIYATGAIPMSYGGLEFTLTSLSISNSWDFNFSGRVRAYPESGMPEFLVYRDTKPTELAIQTFTIRSDGSLGDIILKANNLEGQITQGLYLESGTIGIDKRLGREGFVLSLSNAVARIGSTAPQGLAGMELGIVEFILDAEEGKITKLSAFASPDDFSVYGTRITGLTEGTKAQLSLTWSDAAQFGSISIQGRAILPDSMPESLRGASVDIAAFTLGSDGIVSQYSLAATFPGERSAFGSLIFKEIQLAAGQIGGRTEFSVGGSIILDATKFPEGIGGTSVSFTNMRFDSYGALLDYNISLSLPDQVILDTLPIKNFVIGLSRFTANDILVSVRGDIYMPDSFPQGLAGTRLAINKFSIRSSGIIRELDCVMDVVDVDIFDGAVGLHGLGLEISSPGSSGAQNEIIFDFEGSVRLLSQNLPASLRNSSLDIWNLTLSTTHGLVKFNVGLSSALSLDIGGGIIASITKLDIESLGLSFGASVTLPTNYPQGLAGMRIDLEALSMGWDWKIRTISGGLGAMNIKLAGFDTSIEKLYFDTDLITGAKMLTLGSALVTLPQNFGDLAGTKVGVRNASYIIGTNEFTGELAVENLAAGFAGFQLVLEEPDLDVANKKIGFSRALLRLPDLVGGASITMSGVSLSPAGLSISGGGIALPDFELAGGMGFKGVSLEFAIYSTPINGEYFSIAGGGSVSIPGMGTLGAQVSFTNRNQIYPIGLKRAYFEFYAAGPGIPLANTGLYVNGIRGGLAFGPPNEVPQKLRYIFEETGMRIQLGLRVVDQSGGFVLCTDGDIWVDIQNWSIALKGDTTVLKGTLNLRSEVIAAIGARGFYAGMTITLMFVRGTAEVYIFPYADSRTLVSATASVSLGIPARIFLDLPTEDLWLAQAVAELGFFNGPQGEIKGFKAFVTLPPLSFLGSIGVFVDENNKVILEGVEGYSLILPTSAKRSAGFTVAAKAEPVRSTQDKNILGRSDAVTTASLSSALERIVFACRFRQGDPDIRAIAPSGRVYRAGDPGVETHYKDEGLYFVVLNPEPGSWSLEADGGEDPDFEVQVIFKQASPQIAINTPPEGETRVDAPFILSGSSGEVSGSLRVFLSDLEHPGLGAQAALTQVRANGGFQATVPIESFPDGLYDVYLEFQRGNSDFWPRVYAPGRIRIDRSALSLSPPAAFVAAEMPSRRLEKRWDEDAQAWVDALIEESGRVALSWEDNNGFLASGYALESRNVESGEQKRVFAGNLKAFELPGYASGQSVEFRVLPLDRQGSDGPASPWVRVAFGPSTSTLNQPRLATPELALSAEIGAGAQAELAVNIESRAQTGGAQDYLRLRLTECPEGLSLGYAQRIAIDADRIGIALNLSAADSMAPGSYTLRGLVENMGNTELAAEFSINVTLNYPVPRIDAVDPARFRLGSRESIGIYGRSFLPGTRVYLDGSELFVLPGAARSGGRIEAALPLDMEAGSKTLSLRGPGGQEAQRGIEAYIPDWRASALVSSLELSPGGQDAFSLRLEALDGFDGTLSLRASGLPAFLSVQSLSIEAGQSALVPIVADADAIEGLYTFFLGDERGKGLSLSARVTRDSIEPRIDALSAKIASPGQELSIYGSGFGGTGSAWLSGVQLEIIEYAPGRVRARIPAAAQSGLISLRSAAGTSNALALKILEADFNIHMREKAFVLHPDQELEIELSITGSPDEVILSVDAAPDLGAALSLERLIPNASFKLCLCPSLSLLPGDYSLRIFASQGRLEGMLEKSIDISLRILPGLELVKESLPPAQSDTRYSHQLKARNATGELRYELEAGELPYGLLLTAGGKIEGRAAADGRSSFIVRAKDDSGQERSGSYSMSVEDASWSQKGKDGGSSRYLANLSPADSRRAWTSAAYGKIRSLISGSGFIWVLADSGIVCLDRGSGGLRYKIQGDFSWISYAGGSLLAREADSTLRAYSPLSGMEVWRRETVLAASSDGVNILTIGSRDALLLEASSAFLVGKIPGKIDPKSILLWREGSAYALVGRDLLRLDSRGQHRIYSLDSGRILAACADAQGFALVASSGRILILDARGRELASREEKIGEEPILALSDDALCLSDERGTREYLRANLSRRWNGEQDVETDRASRRRGGGGQAAAIVLAREKSFSVGRFGIQSMNRSNGKMIWKDDASASALIASGDRVYAALSNGRIACFNGPNNLKAPRLSVALKPEKPDGKNLWYRSEPELSISADDVESVVARKVIEISGAEERDVREKESLAEGSYGIRVYALDSDGAKSESQSLYLRLDSSAPESKATISAQNGESLEGAKGWYLQPVVLSLSAHDRISGLEGIDYKMDRGSFKAYEEAMLVEGPGRHSLRWTTRDLAGNKEKERLLEVKIDLSCPEVKADKRIGFGIARVSLSATDDASGVERIEYGIDGGAVLSYREPIDIRLEGRHELRYRAIDRAGRASPWQSLEVDIPALGQYRDIALWPETGGSARSLYSTAQAGMRLYADKDDELALELPRQVYGGEYILWRKDDTGDGESFGSFSLNRDAIVHILLQSESTANYSDWSLSSKKVVVNAKLFPQGAAHYSRMFDAGSWIRLAPLSAGEGPPLVFIQESLDLEFRLSIGGAEPYAVGNVLELETALGDAKAADVGLKRLAYSYRLKGKTQAIEGSTLVIPWAEDGSPLSLLARLIDEDGVELARDEKTIRISNRADISLYSPLPGSSLDAGSEYPLGWLGCDEKGTALKASDIHWSYSEDGLSWQDFEAESDGAIRLKTPAFSESTLGHWDVEGRWIPPESELMFFLRMAYKSPRGEPLERIYEYGVQR